MSDAPRPATSGSQSTLERLFPTYAKYFNRRANNKSNGDETGNGKRKSGKAVTYQPKAPTLPQVDLAPPQIVARKNRERTERTFFYAGVGVAVIAGILWSGQGVNLSIQQSELDNTLAKARVLAGQLNGQSDSYLFFTDLGRRINLDKSLNGIQVDEAKILDLVSASVPAGTEITSIEITKPAVATAASGSTTATATAPLSCGPVSDPFSNTHETPLACLQINGIVHNRSSLPLVGKNLSASSLLANVSVVQKTTLAADGSATFTVSADIRTIATIAKSSGGN